MNILETSNALALAQAFDNRTVGEANVRAWHAILADLEAADVMEAIRRHYLAESAWIMPAHVVRLVGEIGQERAKAARQWAPGQFGIPKDDALPEVTRGERLTADDVSPQVLDLLGRLRAELPDAGREKLFPRQVYWEQQQRAFSRQGDAAPNPAYRPGAAADAERILTQLERPGHYSAIACTDLDCVQPRHYMEGLVPVRTVADSQGEAVRLARLIADCRTSGPHDSGMHIAACPDADTAS